MTDKLAGDEIVGMSRSLKKLAADQSDIVGLIAYGLYKTEQSEWANTARPSAPEVNRHHLTLQTTKIGSLRASAESRLTEWFADVNESVQQQFKSDVRAELEAEFDKEMVEQISRKVESGVRSELERIRRSTLLRDLTVAVVAWLISLAITALVVFVSYGPSITDVLRKMISIQPAIEKPDKTGG